MYVCMYVCMYKETREKDKLYRKRSIKSSVIRYCLRLGTSAILFCKKTDIYYFINISDHAIASCEMQICWVDFWFPACYYLNKIQWNLYTIKYVVLAVVATLAVVERWALWGEPDFYLYLKIYSCPNVLRTYQCSQKLPLDDINLFLVAFFEHL